MAWLVNKLTGSEAADADRAYEDSVNRYSGDNGMKLAQKTGEANAQAVGANTAQNAAQAAASVGADKGTASAMGQAAGNEATQNSVAGKTQEAAAAQQDEIKAAEEKAKQASSDYNEMTGTMDKIGGVLNGIGTAALSATPLGPLGGGLIGGLVGAGRSALSGLGQRSNNKVVRGLANLGSLLLSDERKKYIMERCRYNSPLVKDERLLHLRDE